MNLVRKSSSEISKTEPKARVELNEENFLIAKIEPSEENFLIRRVEPSEENFPIAKAKSFFKKENRRKIYHDNDRSNCRYAYKNP